MINLFIASTTYSVTSGKRIFNFVLLGYIWKGYFLYFDKMVFALIQMCTVGDPPRRVVVRSSRVCFKVGYASNTNLTKSLVLKIYLKSPRFHPKMI